MSFIRTTTFTMSREDAEEIRPGKLVYSALIVGRKFIAQNTDGLVQTYVLKGVTPYNGRILFTIYSEWSTMEDLQAYATQPTIKELEEQLAKEIGEPLQVTVYENIG
jgi:heme-degrading monooxygenase HmoA